MNAFIIWLGVFQKVNHATEHYYYYIERARTWQGFFCLSPAVRSLVYIPCLWRILGATTIITTCDTWICLQQAVVPTRASTVVFFLCCNYQKRVCRWDSPLFALTYWSFRRQLDQHITVKLPLLVAVSPLFWVLNMKVKVWIKGKLGVLMKWKNFPRN